MGMEREAAGSLPVSIKNTLERCQRAAKEKAARERPDEYKVTGDLFEQVLPLTSTRTPPYPALFTRVPVFGPLGDRTEADTDWRTPERYETPWGVIERFGPGLDMYDEDTILAMLHLCRQKKVVGPRRDVQRRHLTAVGRNELGTHIEADETDDEIEVYEGCTSAYRINKYLGRPTGGKGLRECRESIQRLALTQLFFHQEELKRFRQVNFFLLAGDRDPRGEIWVQFNPAMSTLLKHYTYINIDVRRQLSDTGKAVHKFLSSQPRQYKIGVDKLMMAIGYRGEAKKFRTLLKAQLKKLQEIGWLTNYVLSGTGRATPFVLYIER